MNLTGRYMACWNDEVNDFYFGLAKSVLRAFQTSMIHATYTRVTNI